MSALGQALLAGLDDEDLAELARRLGLPPPTAPLADDGRVGTRDAAPQLGPVPDDTPAFASESDSLLTPEQVADRLGYTVRYVYRLGREGALPRVKPPGRKYVRFPLSGVLAFEASGRALAPRRARAERGAPPQRRVRPHGAPDLSDPSRPTKPRPRKRF